MAKMTHSHVRVDGKTVLVKHPKGSVEDCASFKENMLGVAAKAAVRRALGKGGK